MLLLRDYNLTLSYVPVCVCVCVCVCVDTYVESSSFLHVLFYFPPRASRCLATFQSNLEP